MRDPGTLDLKIFGEFIWYHRTANGITRAELVKKTGLSKNTIQDIEHGRIQPTEFKMEVLCQALGVTWVIGNTGTEQKKVARMTDD